LPTRRSSDLHPKLYAEVDAPRQWDGVQLCTADWMGFQFLELSVADLRAAPIEQAPPSSDGTLMLKYVPRTGAWGEHELCQVTLTPANNPDRAVERQQAGVGAVRFHRATWSELPTLHHVVNALAELPIIEPRGGSLTHSR